MVLSLRYQQLDALLRQGVPVNTKNRLGQTPAMVACYIPDEDKGYRMFKFLLKKGADILETDQQRTSVFQHACRQGRERIARKIVRETGVAGADLAGKDRSGRSPLFDAVTSGNVSLVRFIVRLMKGKSLDVDASDNSGTTPLIQAHKLGFVDVATVLQEEGHANPRICDGERHMNAVEWADEAARRRLRAQALVRQRAREHRMIYSRNRTNQKLQPVLPSLNAKRSPSLPDIRPKWHQGAINAIPDIIGGKNWNSDSKRIAERNSNSWVVQTSLEMSKEDAPSNSSVMNKSVDTAMTMLDLASKTSGLQSFATNFVSSEFDRSKAGEYVNMEASSINSLMGVYASQFSSNFRKPAKPPPESIAEQPPILEKKPSTLAYIMGHGPKPKARRSSKRDSSSKPAVNRKQLKLRGTSRRGSATSTDSCDKSQSSTKVTPDGRKYQDESSESDEPSLTHHPPGEEDPDTRCKSRRKPKTLQPSRLSRVPEDDQGQSQQPMSQRLNPRDSLPNIRVTIPSV